MQKPDSLIFDMDGTLWDAVDSYTWIWNEGFRQLNLSKRFTREQMITFMGKQPDELIAECLQDTPEQADIDQVYQAIFGLQEKTMPLLGGNLYEGVREGLEKLAKEYKLFVLSNCESYGIRQFLQFTRLDTYFTDTLSFGETRLPKALNMQLLMTRHGLSNPAYIGDTDSDRIQTETAGLPFIYVNYGFGKAQRSTKEFDNFPDLTEYFLNL
ncbi:MAG: HAD family hydrolase [Bacteroidales bacterium]